MRRPDILARYQDRYQHILVDEFQDTNTVQYALISRLSAKSHNIFCVGDEDQSIYKWRGADFRNIQRFREHNPGLTQIVLEENYRSTQTILDAARGVIDKNTQRTRKNLFTQRSGGTAISVYEAYNQDDEAQYVVDTIQQLIKKQQYQALRLRRVLSHQCAVPRDRRYVRADGRALSAGGRPALLFAP